VEIVARHGALSDLEVYVLGVQVVKARIVVVSRGIHVLKESLNMASWMLRAGSIETVGKKKNQAWLSQPL